MVRACCLISACDSQARHPRLCFDAVNEDADGGTKPHHDEGAQGPLAPPGSGGGPNGDMLSVPARC